MEDLVKFFFELGRLRDEERSGWKLISVDEPESVAEHSFRAALIGFTIAREEKADADKVVRILLFHDVPEARIGDLDKLALRYLNKDEAEKNVIQDQSERMPDDVAEEFRKLVTEFENHDSEEAIVARDADLLECAIQAKEYMDQEHEEAKNWINNVEKAIQTETAKQILRSVKEKDKPWWEGLKEL